jgi:hypothetical protein
MLTSVDMSVVGRTFPGYLEAVEAASAAGLEIDYNAGGCEFATVDGRYVATLVGLGGFDSPARWVWRGSRSGRPVGAVVDEGYRARRLAEIG